MARRFSRTGNPDRRRGTLERTLQQSVRNQHACQVWWQRTAHILCTDSCAIDMLTNDADRNWLNKDLVRVRLGHSPKEYWIT